MADDSFNGATATLATVAIGPIRSISVTTVGAKADTTASEAAVTAKSYAVSTKVDTTLTIEILGGVTVAVADTGDLDITWGDIGGSVLGSIANAQVVSVSTSGSMDGEITSSVEFTTAAPIA